MRFLRAAMMLALTAMTAVGVMAQAEPEKKLVTVWGVGFGPDTKGFEAVVREFERRNPDFHFEKS